MSMHLKVVDLKAIVDAVEKLETSGLDVTQVKVADHSIWLKRHIDETRGELWYEVLGISDKLTGDKPPVGFPNHLPGMRGKV